MIDSKIFGSELKMLGYDFYTGVPCSFLKGLINYAVNNCNYISATNEGDAVAIASGAFISGKKAVVLMQNSGLSNAVSPLVSLNFPFRIPILGFVSLRGEPGLGDEPQHELMGQITEDMLKLMRVDYEYLSKELFAAKKQLAIANECIEKGRPFFFIVKKNTFEVKESAKEQKNQGKNIVLKQKQDNDELPTRYDALKIINSVKDKNTILVATTGMTGRELYEIEDAPNNIYMVGSMGCISAFGLGMALNKTEKDFVVIDGDGSLLMHMGNLPVNGYYNPGNLVHILLDNSSYDSTGGQSTVSCSSNLVSIAASSGYASSKYAHSLAELEEYIKEWKRKKGLTFIYLKIMKGSKDKVGRPKLKPYEIKDRLEVFMSG